MTSQDSMALAATLRLTKQQLVDMAPGNVVPQAGAVVIDDDFPMPAVSDGMTLAFPAIDMFVASADGSITPTGTNAELNNEWMPMVSRMADAMQVWLTANDVELVGDAYITASVTRANEVNDEPHFDDDQFISDTGVGVVAIVADKDGPRATTSPVEFPEVRAPRPLTVDDDMKAKFADGTFVNIPFGPHQLIVFPQFGQMHAGPGPCGTAEEVRHLLVYRAATRPLQ